MATTPVLFDANAVLTAAYTDIGAYGVGDPIDAADAQDGLRRLNRFVSQLKTQEFTVPFISREVFPITASQNTYTIGPGGDFDTQRPQSIEGAGLLLSPSTGSFAITFVDPDTRTFTVAGDQTGSFPSGSDFIVTGSTSNDGSYTIVSATYSTSTAIVVANAIVDDTINGTIAVFGEENSVVEIPIGILTDNAYQAIQVKGMLNTQWTQIYYNQTYAGNLGTIWVWPKPNTNVNAMVLYLDQYVTEFADLTTDYSFPPGYFEVFEYGLANRLLAPKSVKDPIILQEVKAGLSTALALVKRTNIKRNDMPIDSGAILNGPGSLYNILTGNG